ncbi:MAG TPA: alpha/beta hydrolase [Pyrinomonadaceae bacterium]|nr:alpha/beta hydrolase [Pyrinomonadaceae bacterium]
MEQSFRISDAGKFVTIEGLRLHYVSLGSGSAVVLLHGNAGFTHDFSRVLPAIAERGYRAIAFDRPGHGQSERPSNGLATAEFQFKLIRKALRRLKIEKPILVGHSWSAILVLAYALKYEKEISGIVLLAPAAYPEEEQFAAQKALIEIPGLGDLILKVSSPFISREIRQNLERAFSPDEVPADYLELATATWNTPDQIKAIVQDEANYSPAAEELSLRYSEIRTPTVIVTGDSDLEVNPEQHALPLHDAIKHSRLIVLPATGHMIPHTRPDAVIDAVELVRAQSSL